MFALARFRGGENRATAEDEEEFSDEEGEKLEIEEREWEMKSLPPCYQQDLLREQEEWPLSLAEQLLELLERGSFSKAQRPMGALIGLLSKQKYFLNIPTDLHAKLIVALFDSLHSAWFGNPGNDTDDDNDEHDANDHNADEDDTEGEGTPDNQSKAGASSNKGFGKTMSKAFHLLQWLLGKEYRRRLRTNESLQLSWRKIASLFQALALLESAPKNSGIATLPNTKRELYGAERAVLATAATRTVRLANHFWSDPAESTREILQVASASVTIHDNGRFYWFPFLDTFLPSSTAAAWLVPVLSLRRRVHRSKSWDRFAFALLARGLRYLTRHRLPLPPVLLGNDPSSSPSSSSSSSCAATTTASCTDDVDNHTANDEARDSSIASLFSAVLLLHDLGISGTSLPQPGRMALSEEVTPLFCLNGQHSEYWPRCIVQLLVNEQSRDQTLPLFRQMLVMLGDFCHPSNQGWWSNTVYTAHKEFVSEFAKEYERGLRKQQQQQQQQQQQRGALPKELIEAFVDALLPNLKKLLMSKDKDMCGHAGHLLGALADIAPEKIVPVVVEDAYSALSTLTEAHRTLSMLYALSSVSRALVLDPTARSEHLMALLHLALPGIDPNDHRKTATTLTLFTGVARWMPRIGSSSSSSSSASTVDEYGFAEWVELFFDRLVHLVKITGGDEDDKLSLAIASRYHCLLRVLLPVIPPASFDALVDKTFEELTGDKGLDRKGQYVYLCHALAATSPHKTVPRLFAFVHHAILDGRAQPLRLHASVSEKQVLGLLGLLNAVSLHAGDVLLQVRQPLVDIVDACFQHFNDVEEVSIPGEGSVLLHAALHGLCQLYPQGALHNCDQPSAWGQPATYQTLKVNWHQPSAAELAFAKELINKYFDGFLLGALETELGSSSSSTSTSTSTPVAASSSSPSSASSSTAREGAANGTNDPVRQKEWLCFLITATTRLLRAAAAVLPYADPSQKNFRLLDKQPFQIADGNRVVAFEELSGLRTRVAGLVSRFLVHIQTKYPNHTALHQHALKLAAELAINPSGVFPSLFVPSARLLKSVYATHWPAFTGKHVRSATALVDSLYVRHLNRLNHWSNRVHYSVHFGLLRELLPECLSPYPEVSKSAQSVLFSNALKAFPFATRPLLTKLIPNLTDTDIPQETLTGTIACFQRRTLTRIAADPILRSSFCLELCRTFNQVHRDAATHSGLASLFSKFALECDSVTHLTQHQITAITANVNALLELLFGGGAPTDTTTNNNSTAIAIESKLHWQYQLMVSVGLLIISNPQVLPSYPPRAFAWVARSLVSDILPLRLFARSFVSSFVKYCLRGPAGPDGAATSLVSATDIPTEWTSEPSTAEPSLFFDLSRHVCSINDPELRHCLSHVKARRLPSSGSAPKQPSPPPSSSPLAEHIVALVEHAPSLEALFEYASRDFRSTEHASFDPSVLGLPMLLLGYRARWPRAPFGQDLGGFSQRNARFWYQVCRCLDEQRVTQHLFPLLDRHLFADEKDHQLAALELLAGVLRASKFWSFSASHALWTACSARYFEPGFFQRATIVNPWLTALRFACYNLDPRRYASLVNPMIEQVRLLVAPTQAEGDTNGNGNGSSAYRTPLQQTKLIRWVTAWLSEFSCRGAGYARSLLPVLVGLFSHPFRQVREAVAELAIVCLKLAYHPAQHVDFVDAFWASIEQAFSSTANGNASDDGGESGASAAAAEDDEDAKASNASQSQFRDTFTVMSASLLASPYGVLCTRPYFGRLVLPLFVCKRDQDKDVAQQATLSLARLSQEQPASCQAILETLQVASRDANYRTRSTALPFLRLFCFTNQFNLSARCVRVISSIVKFRLVDPHPEVREHAGQALSSLLNNVLRPELEEWFHHSMKLAKTALLRDSSSAGGPEAEASRQARIRKRHGGVLGLCAIMLMSPYDTPFRLPEVLGRLSQHLPDAFVIQQSVERAVAEFRRTHVDQLFALRTTLVDSDAAMIRALFVSDTNYFT